MPKRSQPRKPKTLEDFMTQVEKKDSGCWEWVGYRDRHGYGWKYWNGKDWAVHRLIMTLLGHKLSSAVHVCHKCDNPPCCNPEHLFLGDYKANIADKVAKGRQSKGVNSGLAKLTEQQVEDIRNRYAQGGVTQVKLAEEFGISDGQVSCLLRNISYADPSKGRFNFHDKLSLEKAQAIREEYSQGGVTYREIAAKYGVDKTLIGLVVHNKIWKPKNA